MPWWTACGWRTRPEPPARRPTVGARAEPAGDLTVADDLVPGLAAQHQLDLLTAVAVLELRRRAPRCRQVAVTPLLHRHEHRVEVDALVGQPVLEALALAGLAVGLAAQDALVEQ